MRIVLASLGSLGDLFPMLSLAVALRERGHSPVVAAPATHAARVAALGIPFHPLRPDFTPDVMTELFRDAKRAGKLMLGDLVFPAARQSYADLLAAAEGADALLAGELVYVAPLVAKSLGLPWANVMLSPTTLMSADDPCVLPWFPAAYHLRHLGGWPQRLLFRLVRKKTNAWAAPLHALEHELGMGSGDVMFKGKFSPHLVLALFPAAFAPVQRDWPAASVQTGFPFLAQPADPAIAARIAAFLAAGPPPVVFTLGTAVVDLAQDFYQVAADTAQALGYRAVLLLGRNPPPKAPVDKVLALDYAPHASLFPHAAAVVQHGGIGGCAEVLRAGVPVLTIPFATDQPDNAARLQRMGVGAVLSRRHLNRETLQRSLGAVLADTGMAARARAIAAAMDPARDMARNVEAIEALARSKPVAPPA